MDDTQEGALSGEGANFFVLADQKSANSYACISGIETFYKPKNQQLVQDKINDFLKHHELDLKDIDLVILGYNGNPELDGIYSDLENSLFSNQCDSIFQAYKRRI